MPVIYHYDVLSQPARSVLLFIKVNDIPVEEKTISIIKGENKTEEFKKVSPFGKVPVIDHDGFVLSESVAILQYLAATFNTKDHWYPKANKTRARIDEYLAWHHSNLRKTAVTWVRQVVLLPLLTKQPVDDAVKTSLTADYDQTLDEFERYFLSTKEGFIGGANDISIADLIASQEIDTNAAAGHDTFTNRPVLKAYMDRVRAKLQPHYGYVQRQVQAILAAVSAQK
uniref:Glutathione transferase n=1 Tax=Plectus sambesii TaxID=2011161 RepID=A0A914WKP8_9BILA